MKPRHHIWSGRQPQAVGWIIVAWLLAGVATAAVAQSLATPYQVLGAGGGTSTNGRFSVQGTIGQPVGTGSTNVGYVVRGGFWPASQILHPPKIRAIANQVVREDDALRNLQVLVDDFDSPDSALRVTQATSSALSILSPEGITVRGTLLSLQPVTNAFGQVEVRVRAMDEDGLADETAFGLEVIPVNDAPRFTLVNHRVVRCAGGGRQGVADLVRDVVPGPENELRQGLAFEVTGADPRLYTEMPRLGLDGTLVFGSRAGVFGTNRLTLVLRDNGGEREGGREVSEPQFLDLILASTPILVRGLPSEWVANEGDGVELKVAAESASGVVFRWFRDGLELPGETNPFLRIGVVRPFHAGLYAVEVANACGTERSEVKLSVVPAERAPSIVGQPADATFVECQDELLLKVGWTGSQPARFQWRVNGENVDDGPVEDSACGGTEVNGARTDTLRVARPDRGFGGLYSVTIENALGTVESRAVVVRVGPPALFVNLPATNRVNVGKAVPLAGRGGEGYASNRGMRSDLESALDAGQPAEHPVWFRWIAPSGDSRTRVTFRTAGSTLDTILAVATNLPPSGSPLVLDREGGRFHTSRIQFIYEPGREYYIYVDGSDGRTGDILLSWRLDRGPAVLVPPLDQVLRLAETDTATFAVSAQDSRGGDELLYQWERSDRASEAYLPIEGETESILRVKVSEADIGSRVRFYRVVVRDRKEPNAGSVTSEAALLEVVQGVVPGFEGTFDRTSDAIRNSEATVGAGVAGRGNGTEGRRRVALAGAAGLHAGQSVAAGRIFTHNRLSTHERGERNHGDVIGGRSRWFVLQPEKGGLLRIDTQGSEVPTVIVVYDYRADGAVVTNLTEVARSDTLNPGGPPYAIVRLFVPDPPAGRPRPSYLVVVDTPGAVAGLLQINLPADTIPIDEGFRWVQFQPGVADDVFINLEENGYERVYFIFTGRGYDSMFEQTFADDAGEDGVQRVVRFPAVPNAVYLMAVDQKDPGKDGEVRFTTPLHISGTPEGRLKLQWKAAGYDLAWSESASGDWKRVTNAPAGGAQGTVSVETRVDVRSPRFFRLVPNRTSAPSR